MAVQQPDADDRHAQVASRLEMVTGQDAQSAGVLRQDMGDAELRGEVGDRARRLAVGTLIPAVLAEIPAQILVRGTDLVQEALIRGECVQPLRRNLPQQPHRVVPHGLPQVRVDGGENFLGGRMPRPTKVVDQLAERRKRLRQHSTNGESSDGSHPRTVVALGRVSLRGPGCRRDSSAPDSASRGRRSSGHDVVTFGDRLASFGL